LIFNLKKSVVEIFMCPDASTTDFFGYAVTTQIDATRGGLGIGDHA